MKVVWKFPVPSGTDAPPIQLPKSGRVVHVAMDQTGSGPAMWVEHYQNGETELRRVGFVGTGQSIPDGWEHCGSCISPGGFVWHVYMEARHP